MRCWPGAVPGRPTRASYLLGVSAKLTRARLPCSCYEIYGGKVFDLLNGRKKLEVREDGRRRVQVVGLREVPVGSLAVLQQLCDHSAAARSTGSTGANDESSR